MVRQTDDGQNAVRDRSLLDTKVIGAGGRRHGDLGWVLQNDIFRTVFPVNGECVGFLDRGKGDFI